MRDFPDPGEPDKRSARRYLWWLARRQGSTVVLGMVFNTTWMVSQALVPAAVGRTIDAGIIGRDARGLVLWSLVVLGLGAIRAASGISYYRNAQVNHVAAGYLTVQVVTRKAVALGATLPKLVASGDIVAVGTSDLAELGSGLDVSAGLVGSILAILVVAAIVLLTSIPLGLIVLFGVPVLTALTGLLLRPLHRRQGHYRQLQGELTGRAVDIASGLRVLRGIGGERAFAARYRCESGQLRNADIAVTRIESGIYAAQILLPGLVVAVVTYVSARFALDQRLSVGELVAFYGSATFLAAPLSTVVGATDRITRGLVAAGRVVRILNLRPEITDPAATAPDVHALATLADATSGLLVPPGSLYAVACSDPRDTDTLALRLTRFEDTGEPTLGGRPLASFPVAELRARVLLARNGDRLFNGTVREEVTTSREVPPDQLDAAIRSACADDVIEALPDGLDTPMAGGSIFSGGQLQRLRLVRTLLRRSEITVLVDPTGAVDAHTETRIAEHLADLHTPANTDVRTTVVFTLSPPLLDRAHRVAYVEDGKVVAVGTHHELLAQVDGYHSVVTRGEYAEDSP